MQERFKQHRYFLKDSIRKAVQFAATDQNRYVPPPPAQKPYAPGARTIELAPPAAFTSFRKELLVAMRERRSVRDFSAEPLTLTELAFLLWSAQGVSAEGSEAATFRTVPSAGARHALETYVYAHRVQDLTEGIYRYLPVDHELLFEFTEDRLAERLTAACLGQEFVGQAAVVLIWTTIPYRMEWRYGLAAHRVIPMDAGHACQNVYLACEAIGAGACAVGAYDQEAMDSFLRVDGNDEFTLYLAPVGRKLGATR